MDRLSTVPVLSGLFLPSGHGAGPALWLWLLMAAAFGAAASLAVARRSAARRQQAAADALEQEVRQRRIAEQAQADCEQRLAITLASIGAAFLAADRQGSITQLNAVGEHLTGWTEAQALGRPYWQVLQREGRPAELLASNPVERLLEDGVTIETSHHIVAVARDGRRTAVEVKADLLRAADGTPNGLAMVFRDETAALKEQAESSRLAAIVESSDDAIIGKSLDGRITSWNRAAETIFGYSAEEAIGQPVQMLFPPEREAEEMRILSELARGARVPAFETVRRAKDGRLLDVSLTISPIRDGTGRIVGASKIVRDITPQRRAEAALREAEQVRQDAQRLEAENREIVAASRMKSQFLANMSHELRTPLNAIIGFADLLHAGRVPVESPKHRQFLGHIASSGRHLLQLINDVLDLSKVEAGKFQFVPVPLQLPQLVHEVGDMLLTALQHKHIRFAVELDPAVSTLVVDPGRLKQVLYNYLSNAIKFTPDGGRVTLRAQSEGEDAVRIEVEDSGIGVAESDLPRLFVEFQQLDAGYSKQHQGTGLGLALTRRLVQAQGGSVGVRSVLGQGSVFHLVLPRRPLPVGVPRWLVVENDVPLQVQVLQGLTRAGHLADAAVNGDQAIERLAATHYDGMTLGLQLPDQPGLELLARLRTRWPSRQTPVRGVSMAVGGGSTAAFGIADVLGKPGSAAEVVALLAQLHVPVSRRTRVLVIDDDPLALELMQATLTGLNVDATCRLDGRLALQDLDALRPDAIVLDLMMPGFDGFAVLDALRQQPAWSATPVFIWTGMMLSDDEYERLRASAQAIVHKGGGAVAALLEDLQRWRPAAADAEPR